MFCLYKPNVFTMYNLQSISLSSNFKSICTTLNSLAVQILSREISLPTGCTFSIVQKKNRNYKATGRKISLSYHYSQCRFIGPASKYFPVSLRNTRELMLLKVHVEYSTFSEILKIKGL